MTRNVRGHTPINCCKCWDCTLSGELAVWSALAVCLMLAWCLA